MDAINPVLPPPGGMTIRNLSGAESGQPTPEEIRTAGKEFESVFMSMLLKNMRSTVSEDGMFAGDSSDTFGGMFDLFMSQHLAQTDSLGIGKMIEGFLNNSPEHNHTNK